MPYAGPGTYSHHTGRSYEVIGLGLNKDTGEEIVIYNRVDENGKVLWFVRTLDSFSLNAFYIISAHDSEVVPKFRKSVSPENYVSALP